MELYRAGFVAHRNLKYSHFTVKLCHIPAIKRKKLFLWMWTTRKVMESETNKRHPNNMFKYTNQ